jgi:hypothetical protein
MENYLPNRILPDFHTVSTCISCCNCEQPDEYESYYVCSILKEFKNNHPSDWVDIRVFENTICDNYKF